MTIGERKVGFTLQASLYNIQRMPDECRRDPRKEACNGVDERLWEGFDVVHSEKCKFGGAMPPSHLHGKGMGGHVAQVLSEVVYSYECNIIVRTK